MNTPSSQEAEQELDQMLKEYLGWAYELGVKDGTGLPEVVKEAKAAIASYTAKQVLDGQIEEINRHLLETGLSAYSRKVLHDRLTELQQARKELGGEK